MTVIKQEILTSRLGQELSDKEAEKLADLMQVKQLANGEYLIYEDTTDDSLYVVVEGNLEVVKRTAGDGVASIAIIREGHMAGELSFLDSNVHTVGLRALSGVKVLSLAREDFEKIIDKDPQLVYKVMRALARSAHRIMHQMNHEFVELSNYIYKQHGRY
jgi:CRP-like cAMP-binding protein